MTFSKSIKICFIKSFIFSGRAPRSEFWYFYLFSILCELNIILSFHLILGMEDMSNILLGILYIITFFPSLAVSIRRLHDTNKSGWWLLIIFTIIGIIPLIMWLAEKGDDTDNKYGTKPLL